MRTLLLAAALASTLLAQLLGGSVAEEGCIMDPSGRCGAGASQTASEAGCGMDPDGCPRDR